MLQNSGWKPEGKRLLGRPWHRWKNNIRMDLGEIRSEGADWMLVIQERDEWWAIVNMVMKSLVS
jgi:hypothetical protein